jgi:hypothetical protein
MRNYECFDAKNKIKSCSRVSRHPITPEFGKGWKFRLVSSERRIYLNEHFSQETKAEGKSQAETKTANSNEERERERESTEIKKCTKQMDTAPKALRRHELVHEVQALQYRASD